MDSAVTHGRQDSPADAHTAVDVYKAGRLAAHMWRVGETVSFSYTAEYIASAGAAIAFTLPVDDTTVRPDRDRRRADTACAGGRQPGPRTASRSEVRP